MSLAEYIFSRNTVIITRGLQGAGKSTVAQEFAVLASQSDLSVAIHETDNYFQTDDGYLFDPSKVKENHLKNFQAFCKSIDDGINVVIQSNTNVQHWEYRKYIAYAEQNGYSTIVVDLYDNGLTDEELHSRQLHDFPIEKYELVRSLYQSLGEE